MTDKLYVLNIAAGKMDPILSDEDIQKSLFIIHLDRNYLNPWTCRDLELEFAEWSRKLSKVDDKAYRCNHDIFDFLEKTIMTFDLITIYRFMEHVPLSKLLYFIYILSSVTNPGCKVDCIVPNVELLARRIINEKVFDQSFPSEDIITTTELVNEPYDPHASLWTPLRAKYYFELEKRFEVPTNQIVTPYEFDGRNIYMRFTAIRK